MADVNSLALELAKNNDNMLMLQTEISTRVAEFQNQLTAAQEKDAKLREAMLTALEATNNPSAGYEDENIKVTYVKPQVRVGVDVVKLQLEQADIFEQYKKTSAVRSQVRIKVKK